jgi:hypothetical protein
MGDTSIVKLFDSTTVIKSGNEHIILIQDLKKEAVKDWYESPWIASLLIPILVAAAVAWVGNMMNKRKNNLEIEKLKEETNQMKNSFQPIIVSTIQGVNDKLLETKIKALKQLTGIKSEFIDVEQQYFEGEPVFDYDEYLEQIFMKYSFLQFEKLKKFKDEYSYFLSKRTFEKFNILYSELEQFYLSRISFQSADDGETDPNMEEDTKSILANFEIVLLEMRNELHLDNTFIEDFIKAYQNTLKSN